MQFLVKDILNNKNLHQTFVRTIFLGSPVIQQNVVSVIRQIPCIVLASTGYHLKIFASMEFAFNNSKHGITKCDFSLHLGCQFDNYIYVFAKHGIG